MSAKELHQSGKLEVYAVAFIILAITVLSNFYKELFVAEGGKFQIFGNLGIILLIGLFQKWKHIRMLLSILTLITMCAILTGVMLSKSINLTYLALLLGLLTVFYLTTFSNGVKAYLSQD